ncbi:hypothetical protein SK128_025407 [Halocaridina rubra]|uniref:Ionotropic glutamate receptor C-terminal domain-containing protein n=1 Tax=Halocaridina rubra TaxID=373956 RepID=A0AAN8XI25_HALRR
MGDKEDNDRGSGDGASLRLLCTYADGLAGLTMDFRTVTERTVVMSWLLGSMIIIWSYSSNLMSLLAVRYAPRPIQTLRDLIDHDTMVAIFPRRTALSDYVLSVDSGQLKEIADLRFVGRYIDMPYQDNPQILDRMVRKGTHVLATDTIDAASLLATLFSTTGTCSFYLAREAYVPYMLGMVVQKGSPMVAALSHKVRAIFEGGLYQQWILENLPNSTACRNMPSTFTVKEPLAMSNIWQEPSRDGRVPICSDDFIPRRQSSATLTKRNHRQVYSFYTDVDSVTDFMAPVHSVLLAWLFLLGIPNFLLSSGGMQEGSLRRPREEEFLSTAREAMKAILIMTYKPWCSHILIIDGSSSFMAVRKLLVEFDFTHGVHLFEILALKQSNNKTKEDISNVISQVSKLRKFYKCVVIMVVSGDRLFLESFVGAYNIDMLTVWNQHPIIVTNISLEDLQAIIQKHWPLFATNDMAIRAQDTGTKMRRADVYTHLPFSPISGGQVIRIASWTPFRGLEPVPLMTLIPETIIRARCDATTTVSVKEALKNPVTMYKLLKSPGTFRFQIPVTVVIAIEHWFPHVILQNSEDQTMVGGSMGNLLEALADSLNFT